MMPVPLSPTSRDVSRASEERFSGMSVMQQAEMAGVAVASAAKAEIESSYILAMKNPRNEDDSRARIINACRNLKFAEVAKYSKPVGGKPIVGPSIRFAEEAIRLWRNIKTIHTTIYDDPVKRVVKVTVIDLESNVSYSKDIIIEKTVERKEAKGRVIIEERANSSGQRVFIVQATEDELMNKEAALASKTIRNNGLRLIPDGILTEAMEIVDQTVKSGVNADPAAAKNSVMDNFAKLSIMPQQIVEYLGHALDTVSALEIADLRQVFNSIKEGHTTWAEIMDAKRNERKDPETAQMVTGNQGESSDDGLIVIDGKTVPRLTGESQWDYEERVASMKKPSGGAFKAGDPSTHQGVSRPLSEKGGN